MAGLAIEETSPLNRSAAELPADLIDGLIQRTLSCSLRMLEQISLDGAFTRQVGYTEAEQAERQDFRR